SGHEKRVPTRGQSVDKTCIRPPIQHRPSRSVYCREASPWLATHGREKPSHVYRVPAQGQGAHLALGVWIPGSGEPGGGVKGGNASPRLTADLREPTTHVQRIPAQQDGTDGAIRRSVPCRRGTRQHVQGGNSTTSSAA